jgi:hypothetical protein
MRPRHLAGALIACVAFLILSGGAAQAGQWTLGTEENQTTAGTKINVENVICKKHGTTELAFTSKILGASIKLTASGADCVSATIDTTKEGVAHGAGTLRLTGVSVVQPPKCVMGGPSHELTTVPLTSDSTATGTKYFPESGTTFAEVQFEGPECPLSEVVAPITGSACGESVHTNAAGTGFESSKGSTLTRVRTILSKAGGCELRLGKSTAQVSGAGDSELSGINTGRPWGAD